MSNTPKSLPDGFFGFVEKTINEEGIFPQPLVVLNRKGELAMYAMAVSPHECYQLIVSMSRHPDTVELIYGLDRATKPNQGTEFADALVDAWMADGIWRPFVINYQHAPRIVRPYDWNNQFWIGGVRHELGLEGIPASAVAPPKT